MRYIVTVEAIVEFDGDPPQRVLKLVDGWAESLAGLDIGEARVAEARVAGGHPFLGDPNDLPEVPEDVRAIVADVSDGLQHYATTIDEAAQGDEVALEALRVIVSSLLRLVVTSGPNSVLILVAKLFLNSLDNQVDGFYRRN